MGTLPPLFRQDDSIDSALAFVALLNGTVPEPAEPFAGIFEHFDQALRMQRPEVHANALSKVHGDWYEWLIALAAWNFHAANPQSRVALPLPNVSIFDVGHLYSAGLYDYLQDLRAKVQESEVELITSNPDFVILNVTGLEQGEQLLRPLTTIDVETLQVVQNRYSDYIGLCSLDRVVGYAAVKYSLRPDRRLQISHEGSLMKALYRHMQTRLWLLNPPGIRYYALAGRIGEADRHALRTVATHSITTVLNTPERAVDDVFQVDSMDSANTAFQTILA